MSVTTLQQLVRTCLRAHEHRVLKTQEIRIPRRQVSYGPAIVGAGQTSPSISSYAAEESRPPQSVPLWTIRWLWQIHQTVLRKAQEEERGGSEGPLAHLRWWRSEQENEATKQSYKAREARSKGERLHVSGRGDTSTWQKELLLIRHHPVIKIVDFSDSEYISMEHTVEFQWFQEN